MSRNLTVHLIANAHIDPVWLWDWREGLNQGLVTCRTVLDLMDEYPELTFNRGEAVIYQHIERADPKTFARIADYVKSGRWDVVGGTFVQPDENLPATEPFVRQYTRGLRYFQSRFSKRVRVAWSADCFGHSEGMPEILAGAGMQYFLFTRPEPSVVPLETPAFWWGGRGGARILACRPTVGWYGTNRDEVVKRLDATLEKSGGDGLRHVACLYGLGDHGGGPSRRHIEDIRAWSKAHPEVRVVHSTMHRFFADLRQEISEEGHAAIAEHVGELNFCLRGCYSSMAKFKFLYRHAEAQLCGAERTDAIVSAKLSREPADLSAAWDHLLFNAFHDILPGTSIERAYDDQLAQVSATIQDADSAQFAALNALAQAVDTRVNAVPADSDMPTGVAALIWNPHARPFGGYAEFEACVDDRQIEKYQHAQLNDLPVQILGASKEPLPFQLVQIENRFAPHIAWRKRAVIPVKLPPMGWSVLEMAWVEGAPKPKEPDGDRIAAKDQSRRAGDQEILAIANGNFTVEAKVGDAGVKISHHGFPFLNGDGLAAAVFEDHFGSWGGMNPESPGKSFGKMREQWTVTHAKVMESGPWRAALWVRLAGKKSRIDLRFHLYSGANAVNVSARVLFDERSARLNLMFGLDARNAEFEVPGGSVVRNEKGNVPGGKWVRVVRPDSAGAGFGFASDAIYDFLADENHLHATVLRSTRYSESQSAGPEENPWIPATDVGELKFNFLLSPGDHDLSTEADRLAHPPVVLMVPAKPGRLPREGSLLSLEPEGLSLLAFKKAEDKGGWILRVQEVAGVTTTPRLTILDQTITLPPIRANQIASFYLKATVGGLIASAADASEYS